MGASASKSRTHGTKRRLSYSSNQPDRPSPPGKPQLVPVTSHFEPDVVTIRWDPPVYDGGSRITGYLVEHRRTGSPHWVRSSPILLRVPELTLSGLEPGWRYQFRVCAQNAAGMSEPGDLSELLTVTLQRTAASAPHFIQELRDVLATENEKAELVVEIRGTPTPTVAWYKDGMEVFSGRRHRIITENGCSTLIIYQAALSDEGEFKCTATNRVGHAVTKATLRMQAPPSIRLPRQYEDGLLFEKDEVIRLKVSVAGKPTPTVTWQHNGEPITNSNRCEVSTNERHATLRIAEARRSDRGEYQVRAVNQLGEDIASFLVTVTDRPQGPGKACVVMTLGRSVTLSWAAPEDDGGCKIGNYIVEYYRIGWNMWLKAATCRQLTTTLGDLIQGSEYKFRVKAENPFGVSEPGEESDVLFIPDPQRGLLSPPEHREEAGAQSGAGANQRSGSGSGLMDWLADSPSPYESVPVSATSPLPERTKRKLKSPTAIIDDEEMRLEKEAFDKIRERGPKAPKRRAKTKETNEQEAEIEEMKPKSITKANVDRTERMTHKNDLSHGSSELMLVILPNRSRETTEERESTKREIIQSFEDNQAGIAPPMSLSAPELGSIEPETLLQRAWVSSTELLHERAMARFYQTEADEERERTKARQRKVSTHSTSSSASSYSQGEMTAAAMFARSSSHEEIYKERIGVGMTDKKKALDVNAQQQTKNNDQWHPSQKRSVITEDHGKQEGFEEEELEDEEDEDYSIESVEEEEEEEDDEDYDLDDDEDEDTSLGDGKRHEVALGESEGEYEERPSKYMLEEDTYHPRNMTPRVVSAQKKPANTNISDNLKAVTGIATAVVSHSITIPVGVRAVSTTISKPMSNLKPPLPEHHVRIEVTPPPETDRLEDQKRGSILRESISPTHSTSPSKDDQQYLPPQFTPDGRYLPNPKPLLPKPILKCRDNSEERILSSQSVSGRDKNDTAPIAFVEAELNLASSHSSFELTPERDTGKVKTKKHVRIAEPGDKRSDLNREDTGSRAASGTTVENRRTNRTKSPSSNEIETDATKCLIHHYSDIVKEFGHVKKASTPLYLNYEDLKAAAQKAESATADSARQRDEGESSYIEEERVNVKQNREMTLEKREDFVVKQEPEKRFVEEKVELKPQPVKKVEPRSSVEKETKKVRAASSKKYDFDERVAQLEKKMLAFQKCDDVEETKESHHSLSKSQQRYDDRSPEPQSMRVNKNVSFQVYENKVHSYVDYLTDVAMFIVACWLYIFKDERLAIPILALMVYRQARDFTKETYRNTKQAIKNKIPARWRRKSQ